jgi:hypothetical protein
MNALTVTIEIPHRHLAANARVHWAAKAKVKKPTKERAFNAALIAMHDAALHEPRWKRATVRAVFFVKDKRGLLSDPDNRVYSLKTPIDGIAAAGVVENDRGLTWLPVEHAIDKANPRVELTFTESRP